LIYKQQQGYRQALLLMNLWIHQSSGSKLSQAAGYIGKQQIPNPTCKPSDLSVATIPTPKSQIA